MYLLTAANDAGSLINSGNGAATSINQDLTTITLSNFSWLDYHNPAAPNAVPDLVGVFGSTPNGLADYSGSFTVRVAAVPEPEQWAMMLGGISLLAAFGKRRRKSAAK